HRATNRGLWNVDPRFRGDDTQHLLDTYLAFCRRPSSIARHTRSGVAGISICVTPNSRSASTTALMTAASAGVVPPSPPARTPSGLVGDGISINSVANEGKTSARGIA